MLQDYLHQPSSANSSSTGHIHSYSSSTDTSRAPKIDNRPLNQKNIWDFVDIKLINQFQIFDNKSAGIVDGSNQTPGGMPPSLQGNTVDPLLGDRNDYSLGYKFKCIGLLIQSLVHISFVNENPDLFSDFISTIPSHLARRYEPTKCIFEAEKLQLLGEGLLESMLLEELYKYTSGSGSRNTFESMEKQGKTLTDPQTLGFVARKIKLDEIVIMSRSAKLKGFHQDPMCLTDVLHCVIAAVFIDGGFTETKRVVDKIFRFALSATAKEGDLFYTGKRAGYENKASSNIPSYSSSLSVSSVYTPMLPYQIPSSTSFATSSAAPSLSGISIPSDPVAALTTTPGVNHKGILQEYLSKRFPKVPPIQPTYICIGYSGPDTNKIFESEVRYDNISLERGRGTSKKKAEMEAALKTLELLRTMPDYMERRRQAM